MGFLDRLLGAPQEMLATAEISAGDARLLHELGSLALGASVLALGLRLGYRGLERREGERERAAFIAIGASLVIAGAALLLALQDGPRGAAVLDLALSLAASLGALLGFVLVPRLFRAPLARATSAPDAEALALYEAEEEVTLLRARVAELEDTVSLFAGATPLVRAPREPRQASERGGAPGSLDGYRVEPGEPLMTSESQPSRPRVLVVEDNRDLNRFLCRCLGQEFEVLSAKNGAEGFEIAAKERPDCVLTDVMMPVMSGEQLVSRLRSTPDLEGIPIVVLTARDDDQLRIKLLKEGVQDFITKPFLTDEVLARVRNLVAWKRAADVLSEELANKRMDLETMAREVSRNRHELQTALQQMQMARDLAERASSVKSNFLRMMSHELRTPIAAMQLQLRLMEKHGADKLEEKQREYLARISRSAQRLLDLVNTVLEYARIESGRFEARVRPFSLTKVLREATEEFQSHAVQKGIRLTVNLPDEDMPELTSDAQVVRLIAVNLIGNGVKHTEEGSVEVGGAYEEGVHMLWVKDTGPGIPREHQMEVFEPFQRFEDIRQLQGAGSGLGLAIVRDMVRAVGGDISLESDVGKGALFRVTLPMLPVGDGEDSDSQRTPPTGSFLHH